MRHRSQRSLPDPLRTALGRFAEALQDGQAPAGLLGEVLDGLAALPPEGVTQADRQVRRLGMLWEPPPSRRLRWPLGSWAHGSPGLTMLARTPRLERLFVFHSNGVLREAALRRLDGALDSPFLAAAVILRLNDWVPQVRRAAEACAARVLPRTDAPTLARALLGLADRTGTWRRWDGEPPVIAALRSRADVTAALVDLFGAGAFGGVARALRQGLQGPAFDASLPALAFGARQPAVRAVALEALIDGQAAWVTGFERQWIDKTMGVSRRRPVHAVRPVARPRPIAELIDRGLADRARIVRRVAADGAVRHRAVLPDLEGLVSRLLADGSAAVRGRGEHLRRQAAPAGATPGP